MNLITKSKTEILLQNIVNKLLSQAQIDITGMDLTAITEQLLKQILDNISVGGGDIKSDGTIPFVAAEQFLSAPNSITIDPLFPLIEINDGTNITQIDSSEISINAGAGAIAKLSANNTQAGLQIDGSIYYSKKVSLNSAQIKTLNSLPIELISAKIGIVTEVISVFITMQNSTVPFSFISWYVNTETLDYQFTFARINTFGNGTYKGIATNDFAQNLLVNKSIQISSDADSLVGDGDIIIYLFYRETQV